MGQLDKALASSLPKVGSGTVSDASVSYAVADGATLVNESFSAIQKTFGDVANFTTLNVGAPTFATLGVSSLMGTMSPSSAYLGVAAGVEPTTKTSSSTAGQIKEATGTDSGRTLNDDHIVKLISKNDSTEVVMWTIMPEVSEQRTADYEPLSVPHMPGDFQKYKSTKSVSWQIVGTFTCRTRDEAQLMHRYIQLLRAWTLPYFGEQQGANLLGAPPPVLDFSGWRGIVGTVPVIMTSSNWNWPRDCDWIPTGLFDENGQEIPFPTVMNVNVSLTESYSASQFNDFNLASFKSGNMVGAFSKASTQQTPVSEPTIASSRVSSGSGEATGNNEVA